MAYPDEVLAEGERVVVHLHPHWKMLIGPVLVLLGTVVVTTLVAGWIAGSTWGLTVLGVVALVLVVWLTVVPVIRWRTTHLVLTDRRVLVREGILTRQGIDLPTSRIESARLSRTVLDRLLGSGTITIETASGDPLEFEDVPDVQRVYALLYTGGRGE